MSDISLGVRDPRDVARAVSVLESAVEELRNQLDRERQRADSAERELAQLDAEIIHARVEMAGLRCQLNTARLMPQGPVGRRLHKLFCQNRGRRI